MIGALSRTSGTNANNGNLVQFRAGRMDMIGKRVSPDRRKGLVYLTQSEDGLMHFCWKDSSTDVVEDDVIVNPNENEFKRVEQCTTGRVYILKSKSSSLRLFYWMQGPKIDKDAEYCRRVNEFINNPPPLKLNNSGDLQGNLNATNSAASLFSVVSKKSFTKKKDSKPTSATASKTPSAAPSQHSLKANPSADEITSANPIIASTQSAKIIPVKLPDTEDADKIQQIEETMASPQFQQALSLFSTALQLAGVVMSRLKLTPDAVAAASENNLDDFVTALEKVLPAGVTIEISKEKNETEKDPSIDDDAEELSTEKEE